MAAAVDPYVEHCLELLRSLGACTARRMFGGWGISHDGLNVGLIIEGTLYVKADEQTKPLFIEQGCKPFEYTSARGTVTTSYLTVPDEAMDSRHLMQPWAKLAFMAALRAANAKKPRAEKATAKKATTPAIKTVAKAASAKTGKAVTKTPTKTLSKATPKTTSKKTTAAKKSTVAPTKKTKA